MSRVPRRTRRTVLSIPLCLCASVALFLGASLLAQQPGSRPGRPTRPDTVFRSGVEAVEVDVYVSDENDEPVTGLTRDDFEVFENGIPQTITTFAPVSLPVERSEPLPFDAESDVQTNAEAYRHVYLFILGPTSVENALRARHQLHDFMNSYFSDNDVAAIVGGRGLVTNGQDFTSNRRLLIDAIDKFDGDGPDTRDLPDLMKTIARIPGGRKSVLWVTGNPGIDPDLMIDYRGGVLGLNAEAAHDAISTATRGNIRLYIIDPEGLGSVQQTGNAARDMFTRALARMTGGFAHLNSNRFTESFERLVRETSTYYVLGFNSTEPHAQGRYVHLEVRLKRAGLKVQSRNGYLERLQSITRYEKPEPERTPVEAALGNPVSTSGMPIRVFAAPFKKDGRNATVAMTVEVDASALGFSEQNGKHTATIEIRHLATDARNKIHPEFRNKGTLGLDETAYELVAAGGIRVLSQFEVPDGRYQVRVAAASGDTNGSVVYDLEVPDFEDEPLMLGGVALTTTAAEKVFTLQSNSARTSKPKANNCRSPVCSAGVTIEGTLAPWSEPGATAMLLRDVLPAPPTTARTFSSDDTLTLYTEVYDNNPRVQKDPPYTINVTAELRDAANQVVRTVSEQRPSRAARRPSGGHGFTLRLPMDDLAEGSYVLHVEARSDAGEGSPASRNIPIRVK
ncbi:MAG TPA: VWA domain-containing protein [Vicinamibacterales bacterium]|nr:VWA domain-containing protein [Vicinamibacterales bacterium]